MNATPADYDRIFREECAREYPEVDVFEARLGYSVGRDRLEAAARTLACPLKVNPPSWQHGRILYALARERFARGGSGIVLDIGTAKGFSAVVLAWAMADAEWEGRLISVDVVDPAARVRRNSIEEFDSLKTVFEFVAPWMPNVAVEFAGKGSLDALRSLQGDDHLALVFVDGKHDRTTVAREAALIREHQDRGDYVMFDDLQIPQVALAVRGVSGYRLDELTAGFRRYAVATRL